MAGGGGAARGEWGMYHNIHNQFLLKDIYIPLFCYYNHTIINNFVHTLLLTTGNIPDI